MIRLRWPLPRSYVGRTQSPSACRSARALCSASATSSSALTPPRHMPLRAVLAVMLPRGSSLRRGAAVKAQPATQAALRRVCDCRSLNHFNFVNNVVDMIVPLTDSSHDAVRIARPPPRSTTNTSTRGLTTERAEERVKLFVKHWRRSPCARKRETNARGVCTRAGVGHVRGRGEARAAHAVLQHRRGAGICARPLRAQAQASRHAMSTCRAACRGRAAALQLQPRGRASGTRGTRACGAWSHSRLRGRAGERARA